MKLAKIMTVAIALALMAGTAMAQPGGGQGGRGGRGQGGRGGMMGFGMSTDSPLKRLTDAIDKLSLTDEQKQKIADLKKEYEPKIKELAAQRAKILTDEQKTAMKDVREAMSKATTREERQAAMQKMPKLTDDQQTKMREIGQKIMPLMQEARTKFTAVLTDEQKAKLPPMGGRGGRGGRGGQGGGNPPAREST